MSNLHGALPFQYIILILQFYMTLLVLTFSGLIQWLWFTVSWEKYVNSETESCINIGDFYLKNIV